MKKEDYTGLILLIIFAIVFGSFLLWVSNTGYCLNDKKDIIDYIERFKFCAVRLNY